MLEVIVSSCSGLELQVLSGRESSFHAQGQMPRLPGIGTRAFLGTCISLYSRQMYSKTRLHWSLVLLSPRYIPGIPGPQ